MQGAASHPDSGGPEQPTAHMNTLTDIALVLTPSGGQMWMLSS